MLALAPGAPYLEAEDPRASPSAVAAPQLVSPETIPRVALGQAIRRRDDDED